MATEGLKGKPNWVAVGTNNSEGIGTDYKSKYEELPPWSEDKNYIDPVLGKNTWMGNVVFYKKQIKLENTPEKMFSIDQFDKDF